MERAGEGRLSEDLRGAGPGDPFAAALQATRMAMVITDPRRHDNPIVFANDAFLRLTGYTRPEVTGRNCRFLQGPDTDMAAVAHVRQSVQAGQDVQVDLVNYRKDGSTFHNALYLSPVRDALGEIVYFFGSQLDVSERYAWMRERDEANAAMAAALAAKTVLVREIDHRVKNNLQMISAMIRLQGRTVADPSVQASLRATVERVDALGTVHRRLHESEDVTRFDMAALVRDLASELVAASGRQDVELALDLMPVEMRADVSASLALLLNEVFTNALKHAFPDGRAGRLAVESRADATRIVVVVEDDGVGLGSGALERRSFGTELIETLTRQLGAETETVRGLIGTRVEIRLPRERLVP